MSSCSWGTHMGREETHMLMNNEDAKGEAAFLSCERQAVENGRKGDPNKEAWFCTAYSLLWSLYSRSTSLSGPKYTMLFHATVVPSAWNVFSSYLSGKLFFILQNSDQWPLTLGILSLPTSFDPTIRHLFDFNTSSVLDGEWSRICYIHYSISSS